MSNSVAAFYCVYDDDEWLGYSLASIYPAVDAVYVLLSTRPWNGPATDNQRTKQLLREFPDPEKKLRVVEQAWDTEVGQRNDALALLICEGFKYALIIDADEIYDTASLASMIRYASERPEVGCWHTWFIHYWKSPGFRIDPPEKHHPPVLLKLGAGGFVEYRNCLATSHELVPAEICFCHHMSYARTDEQIRRKITSFSHSHQVNPDWFEKVWKGWDNNQTITDLCPYNPGVFERAVPVPPEALPPVLRQALRT